MTVEELLALLNDLPVDALKKDILVNGGDDTFTNISVEPITESCDDETIVAYIITRERRTQRVLDFGKSVN